MKVALHRKVSDEEFASYLEAYSAYLDQDERYGVIFDVDPSMGMVPMSQARLQMNWMKEKGPRLAEICDGVAFVLTSAVHRGVLKAILTMQSMPVGFAVFASVEDAKAWLLR